MLHAPARVVPAAWLSFVCLLLLLLLVAVGCSAVAAAAVCFVRRCCSRVSVCGLTHGWARADCGGEGNDERGTSNAEAEHRAGLQTAS